MKLKYFSILICMLSILKTTAQNSFSLELNANTIPTREITKNETEIAVSIDKNIDAKNTITNKISFKNSGLNFNLDNYYSTDNKYNLNRLENQFEYIHQFNKKITLGFDLETVAGFENSLDFSDVSFFGGPEIYYSFNDKNRISLGIKRMSIFGKAQVLPSIAFFRQFNPNTSLEIGFPNSSIQYSNNQRNKFSLNNTFSGEYYQLDQTKTISTNTTATKMSFSQMTTSFEYERNLDHNWFISFQGGYQFDKNYRLTNNKGTTQFNFDANDGYLFNIGIKYKQ